MAFVHTSAGETQIAFQPPVPGHDVETQLLLAPIAAHVTLPILYREILAFTVMDHPSRREHAIQTHRVHRFIT